MPNRHLISFLFAVIFLLYPIAGHGKFNKGPYVQNPTKDSAVIMWETDVEQTDTLEWGPTESLGNSMTDDSDTRFHELAITGLIEDTVYYYRVTSGGIPSDVNTFTTDCGTCRPFTFALVGDTRSNHLTHRLNAVKIHEASPDFTLNTGDIVDHGDNDFENELVWQLHFNDEHDLMGDVPLFPVIGNHDTGTESIWERIFALPFDGSGSELYYSYRWGNSLFVVVNTHMDFETGSAQHRWLEQTLADGQVAPEIMHIFVAFHAPPYCVGDHCDDDGENKPVVQHLVPLFETYGVQAVMNGHEHSFQHIERNGVRYIISGGGAASLDRKERDIEGLIQFNYKHHYCLLHIEGASVTLEAYDTFTGGMFYSFSWEDDMGKDPCADVDDDDDITDDDDLADDDDIADDDDAGDDDDFDDNDDSADGGAGDDDDDNGSCCG